MFNIKAHADKNYDRELASLSEAIIKMAELVIKITKMAKRSLSETGNIAAVDEAKATDKEINKLDLEIESIATSIMGTRQPFMNELRLITSSLKIAAILERMGDMAKNTVKRSAKITSPIPKATLAELTKMADFSLEMIEGVISLIRHFETHKAKAIWNKDDSLDEIYKKLFSSLQVDMSADPKNVPSFTHVIFAAKNLERIGDYATALAKIIYYINSGDKVTKDNEDKI